MSDKELLQEIEAQSALMIAVATGGPRIESVNHEYIERRHRIVAELARRRLRDPNPYGDLWQWYGKWSSGDLPTYQSRRKYVSYLYQSLIDRIGFSPENQAVVEKTASQVDIAHAVDATGRPPVEAHSEWDLFVCHATEDKEDFVRPLAAALREAGLRVWYDEFTLSVGDSLRRSIDRGLASSAFGVVVLSPAFFRKEWPQKELDALVAREIEGRKVILPVWHHISADDVRRHSPMLADRVASSSDRGIQQLVQDLFRAMSKNKRDERWIYVTDSSPGPPETESLPRAIVGHLGLMGPKGASISLLEANLGRMREDIESALATLEKHGWVISNIIGAEQRYYLSKKGTGFYEGL